MLGKEEVKAFTANGDATHPTMATELGSLMLGYDGLMIWAAPLPPALALAGLWSGPMPTPCN